MCGLATNIRISEYYETYIPVEEMGQTLNAKFLGQDWKISLKLPESTMS